MSFTAALVGLATVTGGGGGGGGGGGELGAKLVVPVELEPDGAAGPVMVTGIAICDAMEILSDAEPLFTTMEDTCEVEALRPVLSEMPHMREPPEVV